jgi:hypothetical protein
LAEPWCTQGWCGSCVEKELEHNLRWFVALRASFCHSRPRTHGLPVRTGSRVLGHARCTTRGSRASRAARGPGSGRALGQRSRSVMPRGIPKLERDGASAGPRGSRDLDVMQRGVPGLDGLLVHHEDSRSPRPRQAHHWSPTTRMLLVRTYASTCRADHQREILATGVASRHPSSCAGANKRCRVVPRWQSSVLSTRQAWRF